MTKELNQRNDTMRITILFGGTNKERLVSVASAQALHSALPEADLWFWHVADTVHDVPSKKLLNHARPFAEHGKLIAKPVRDGSSYGLIFVNAQQDLVAVRNAARREEYLVEPFIAGVEATCGVLEQPDGTIFSLPPIEIVPADGGFDYTAKYLLKSTQEICPGRFTPAISAQIMDQALKAHRALSCTGYSRTDFIVSEKGPIYLETNTLPGLTKASLYPKALKAQGIEFADFLHDQIALAAKRAQK